MFELIASIILLLSLAGVIVIIARKVPSLNALPKNGTTGLRKDNAVIVIIDKAKGFFVFFEKQIFLHKILSWIKIMTLKVETQVDHWLHSIRQKSKNTPK